MFQRSKQTLASRINSQNHLASFRLGARKYCTKTSEPEKVRSGIKSKPAKPHLKDFWYGFGSGSNGHLGVGKLNFSSLKPKLINSLEQATISSMSVGMNHCIARTFSSSYLYTWGDNSSGQLGLNHTSNVSLPTLIKRFWPSESMPYFMKACSSSTFIGIKHQSSEVNTMWAAGQVARNPDQIQMQFVHIPALDTKKTVLDLAYTDESSLFRLHDGSLMYLGKPEDSLAPTMVDVNARQIAAGFGHYLRLDDSGKVFSIGANRHGQCGVGVLDDLNSWKEIRWFSENGIKIAKIAAGATHSMALSTAGKVYVWGSHKDGKLGLGDVSEDRTLPVHLSFFDDLGVTQIRGGCDHSAIMTKNDLYTWGFGQHGALGTGTLEDAYSPVKIPKFWSGKLLDAQCGMDVTFVHSRNPPQKPIEKKAEE